MGSATRTVERLRLRASSEAAVRRAVPVLEDAFRTATLPDAGARLVFLKRLNLGRLPRGASPLTLSLLVESRVTDAAWALVHAGSADANCADAVWFRDALEAHELAALRVAAGRSLDAWFWRRAVPALEGVTSAADGLRAIALSLAALEEAPAALPAWVTSIVLAGYGERLIAALRREDMTALQNAVGMQDSPASGASGGDRASRAASGSRKGEERRHAGFATSAYDVRREFVERLSRQATRCPVLRPVPPPASENTTGPAPSRKGRRRPLAWRMNGRLSLAGAARSPVGPESAFSLRSSDGPGAVRARRRVARGSAPGLEPHAGGEPSPTQALPWMPACSAPTGAGGLLFLVPALERLGVGPWCQRDDPLRLRAPGAVARAIFHLLLSRLRIAEGDPAWQLAVPADDAGATPVTGEMRDACLARIDALLPARAGRSRARDLRTARTDSVPGLWLTLCRLLLRRQAHIGLATLVVRPGWLALTRTHADVFLPLNGADLRVRRAGLDIDPGWVPWLGKIVAFHYGDRSWT